MNLCEHCHKPLPEPRGRGRRRRYCSDVCRMAAHRARAAMDYPSAMRVAPRWCRWEKAPRGMGMAKRPVMPDGSPASSTDPATWSTLGTAADSHAGDGLGFMLGGGFACIDLDHCRDAAGRLADWAKMIVATVVGAAYIEVSPSGHGLHIWGRMAERPGLRVRNDLGMNIEAYSTGRFVTVTGRRHALGGDGLPDLSFLWSVSERLR